jgi:hypothetical protein
VRNPATLEEWQAAADAAHAALALDSARLYGFVEGGPVVNVARCEELLAEASRRGISPSRDAVEQFVRELTGTPARA